MKEVQPPSYARALLQHVSTHDPPSTALFLPHHPWALFEARSSTRPYSARTSRNIRSFTSTSAVSMATEAWPTSLPKTVFTQMLSAQFRVNFRRAILVNFRRGMRMNSLRFVKARGASVLSGLGSTPQDNTFVKSPSTPALPVSRTTEGLLILAGSSHFGLGDSEMGVVPHFAVDSR